MSIPYIVPRPLKQPLPYEGQIDKLKTKHGLLIDDEAKAITVLKQVNYYRLSAYGISLREPGNKDRYIAGTRFEQLYALYRFDFRLRQLLSAVLEGFEVELRSRVCFHLAMTYGSEGFRNAADFLSTVDQNGVLVHTSLMDKIDDAIRNGSRKPCVMHHNAEYGGRFPVWASIELFTFGNLSSLFGIMLAKDQKAIAQQFGLLSVNQFNGWVLAFRDVRNRCAHNDRIYNMPLPQPVSLFPDDMKYAIHPSNRVFPVILALKRVTSYANLWEWFFNELDLLLRVHPEVDLSRIGFPYGWKKALAPK